MKNKAAIVIAAGAVLASTLAVAPVQAHAATRTLIGSCSEGFACAWGTNGVLFWEANALNIHFAINEDVTYVENNTGYYMNVIFGNGKGGVIGPDNGLVPLSVFKDGADVSDIYLSS